MSNELANPNSELPTFGVSQYADQQTFDALVRSSFLSRVQLCSGNNELVQTGRIQPGAFAFIRNKDDFVDLGKEVQFYSLAYRFVAMRFGDGKVDQYFNPNSDDFKAIQLESEEKDSKCAYGPQFLMWIPQVKDFATFLFGSKSARPEGRKVKALMTSRHAGVMKSRLVTNPSYKWWVPICIPFTSVIEPFDPETARTLAEKFLNHGESSSEADFSPQDTAGAAPTDADAGGRVR